MLLLTGYDIDSKIQLLRTSMSSVRRAAIQCFNFLQGVSVTVLARGMNKELVRRDAERGRGKFRWFTPEEAIVMQALGTLIVPSDEESPGIDEVCVLDPPAIVTLDNLIVNSTYRQHLYSRGLLSFDVWAQSWRGEKFADLPKEDQIGLLREAQNAHESRVEKRSLVAKMWNKLQATLQVRSGIIFASQLYPQIRTDCLQVFYTSHVSWVWLEYDGPPMDKGYPNFADRR